MRRLWGVLLLLLVMGAWADDPILTPAEAKLQAEVAEAYHHLVSDWRRLDAAGVMTHYTPDSKMLDLRHETLDWKGIEKHVLDAMRGATQCDVEYGIHRWKMEGRLCLVVIHQTRVIHYGAKQVKRVLEREDRWRKTAAGWQICDTRYLHQVVTIHGEALPVRVR